ncbi:ABC transporter permease [Marinoscillum sp. MHG1-6]|uniref:ABC transporter permease n=1 Tax=Marinoscillum sp. MHG1-6 TaxID=2959627 RepID=UPI0021579C88|nr:ABC transporter permease [Marinoscillum sp. MHG1-6]
MYKNYFSVALRNLLRHKFYSLINILGLTIGLVCFMMIALFVLDELSYDKFFKDSDRTYRVDFIGKLNGAEIKASTVGPPVARSLKADYPEVEESTRLRVTGNWFIKEKGTVETFKEETVLMAEQNFFEFFGLPMVYGDPATCLERPNTLVMDLSTSRKMFGDENPVGKVLVLDNEADYEVTGVYEDIPQNAHFHHNILLSMKTFKWTEDNDNWLNTSFHTYLKLSKGTTKEEFEAKFPEVIDKYCAPLIKRFLNMEMSEFMNGDNGLSFELFPLGDIHLYSAYNDELANNGDIKYVFIFSIIALFILTLACINFMNLSTARSANRAKEVGVRKVMGAFKRQLIIQFIMETIFLTFVSFLLAIVLTIILLPYFGELASKTMDFGVLISPKYLLIMLIVVVAVGVAAGSYPAFYLSAFKPAEVLKGKVVQGVKSGPVRSILVVFQFSISIIMIIGTAIVFDQLSFIQNKKLGFDKEQVIMVKDVWILREAAGAFGDEVRKNANVISSSLSNFTPVTDNGNNDLHFTDPVSTSENSLVINEAWVDADFDDVLGIQLREGRFFSKDLPSDTAACIMNVAAIKAFGYEDPIGKKLYSIEGDENGEYTVGYRIIGVMEDFHFKSMKSKIEPLVLKVGKYPSWLLVKTGTGDIAETLDFLKRTWSDFAPGQPFAYHFMDQRFDQIYVGERKVGQVFTVFAVLAVIIACLGLFGLAAFTAEQKTKEIGVRKALGASVSDIVNLLSINFLKLVMVAFFVAIPVSYMAMTKWLEDFAYRTDIRITTFVMAGFLAMVIAWVTISSQSWLAARANPVKSLRDE